MLSAFRDGAHKICKYFIHSQFPCIVDKQLDEIDSSAKENDFPMKKFKLLEGNYHLTLITLINSNDITFCTFPYHFRNR